MKKTYLLLLLVCFVNLKAFSQNQSKTTLGLAPTLESNVGFFGPMLSLERQEKLNSRINFVAGVSGFYANKVLDHVVAENEYNRTVIADLGFSFKLNKNKNADLQLKAGLTSRFSKVRHLISYNTDLATNTTQNLKYSKITDENWGYVLGIAYDYKITKKHSLGIFSDARFIDIKSEPTFLNVGLRVGLLK